MIRKIQRNKNMSVMFITHDFGVVAEIADRVVVMEKGKIVEQGKADDVLNHPSHPYTQRLTAAVPRMRDKDRASNAQAPVVLDVQKLNKIYKSGGQLLFEGSHGACGQ